MDLFEHDGAYSIHFNGQGLMHSRTSTSEKLLGTVGCEQLKDDVPSRILIGGLGLGFTLRSVLESVGPQAVVEQVELIPEIIEWNRKFLKDLNGEMLDDPRVVIRQEDVTKLVRKEERQSYDVILLDVDNGPVAMVSANNSALYSDSGIRSVRTILKPGGRVIYWSATPDPVFEKRLRKVGFNVKGVPAKVHEGAKRAAYWLFVADLV
tara:strand:- start:876 stop:1499 length:624 start_codon:yes stop_codon:yes gene_type:complete